MISREKIAEIVSGNDGVRVNIRPALPFEAERFKTAASGGQLHLRLEAGGQFLSLPVDDVAVGNDLLSAEMITLVELPFGAGLPERELILYR